MFPSLAIISSYPTVIIYNRDWITGGGNVKNPSPITFASRFVENTPRFLSSSLRERERRVEGFSFFPFSWTTVDRGKLWENIISGEQSRMNYL